MSLIAGSRSSGSSGPRPNTSSMMSAKNDSRSLMLSGVPLLGDQFEQQRADFRFGARAIGRRERLEIQPVEQLAVDVGLQLEILRRGASAAAAGGPWRPVWGDLWLDGP